MKKILLLICIIFMMLTNVSCSINIIGSILKKTITFRPVNVYVYDEKTKEPLKGITVKVANTAYYEKIYYFLWFPGDSDFRTIYYPLENFETNEEGYVQIPKYTYKIKRKYRFDGQRIYINIETTDKERRNVSEAYTSTYWYKRENDRYQRPINKFKAVEINTCMYFKPTNEEYRRKNLEWSTPFIRSFYICSDLEDLNCGTEEIKIYLEHFVEPEI